MKYNARGEEILDDTPVEMPLKFRRPPTLQESIKAMVRGELSRNAMASGQESFEEADDFEVEDDEVLPPSNYEFRDMPIEKIHGSDKGLVLDKEDKELHNGGTVNSDRTTKESENGRGKNGVEESDSASVGNRVERADDAGQKS